MVPHTPSRQPLSSRLEALERQLEQAWRASPSPTRRLALLRNHFRTLHLWLNELLADPACLSEEQELLRRTHDALVDSARLLRSCSTAGLIHWLSAVSAVGCMEYPPSTSLSPPGDGAAPGFLVRPGREWEHALFRLGPEEGWRHRKVELTLDTSADIQSKMDQLSRQEHSRDPSTPILLGLEKSPESAHLWWVHELAPEGSKESPKR